MADQAPIASPGGAPSAPPSPAPSANGVFPHPAQRSPISAPAPVPHEYFDMPTNPRIQGHSPAMDYRQRVAQQQQSPRDAGGDQQQLALDVGQQPAGQQQEQPAAASQPHTIRIGDAEYAHEDVLAALKAKAGADIWRSGLPAAPENYELKLPANFQAPQGVSFQFDQNSTELQNFRQLAHARGIDQQTFSEALGVYAAAKIGEQQHLAVARDAEMKKLGAAASNRISAVETWLKSQVGGARAHLIVTQLKSLPVASMVEMFETLARNASSQGGATPPSGGHVEPDTSGRIPGYENMSFEQRRAAQDAQAGRFVQPRGRR